MGPEHFGPLWWGGWWVFPIIMPILMIVLIVSVLYLILGGRGDSRPRWWNGPEGRPKRDEDAETAMEILKMRYAKGELTREEFEQMKKDLQD